jgi:hypothetical protein
MDLGRTLGRGGVVAVRAFGTVRTGRAWLDFVLIPLSQAWPVHRERVAAAARVRKAL